MTKGHEIRCYDYVNRPYAQVCDALRGNALAVFQNATKAAASRAHSVAAELHVNIGGIDVGTDIAIEIKKVEEQPREVSRPQTLRIDLEWQAAKSPQLFPMMRAQLAVYPLTGTETQLDFAGEYEPPLGVVGGAVNALVGHRIAEASVHRLIKEVAEYLRAALG